jgi:hypothetical protein
VYSSIVRTEDGGKTKRTGPGDGSPGDGEPVAGGAAEESGQDPYHDEGGES